MISQKTQQNNESKSEKIIKLLEKIEKIERLERASQSKTKFFIPESSPTQGSMEVCLPLSYRQLSRIQ